MSYALKSNGELWNWGILPGYGRRYKVSPTRVLGDSFISVSTYRRALKANGEAWAWGSNPGDNTITHRSSPVLVVGNHSFIQVTSFALKANGEAWSWGSNYSGNLGDGTTTARSSPVLVVGNHSFIQISSSVGALKANGEIWIWGNNSNGRLGDNTTTDRSSPVLVAGNHSFIQVLDSGGLKANGEIWRWGVNDWGQIGDNTKTNRSSPVLVVGNHSFISVVSYSTQTMGLKANGEVWCWGMNYYGQLGNNQYRESRSSPVLVVGNHSFIKIDVEAFGPVALKANGELWGWGEQYWGINSDGDYIEAKSSPVLINAGPFIDAASFGRGSYWLKANGELWAWGDNVSGQLGDYPGNTSSPILVQGSYKDVFGDEWGTFWGGSVMTLDFSGNCLAWGENYTGQLGNGSLIIDYTEPQLVLGGLAFQQIYQGLYSSMALKANGEIWTWGLILGYGDAQFGRSSPVLVVGNHSFVDVSGGAYGVSALKANGECWSMGFGPMGDNTWFYARSSPVLVAGNHSFIQVATGSGFRYGLKENGEVWSWGVNDRGELGNGQNSVWPDYFPDADKKSPVLVLGNHSFIQISAGDFHGLALKENGECWGWGNNVYYGQLGDNTKDDRSSPTLMLGNHSFINVYAAERNSYGLKANGEIWGCGQNPSNGGQLGYINGSRSSPVLTIVGNHSFIQVTGSERTVHGLKENGEVWSWGDNGDGQLGNNTTTDESSPILVLGNHSFIEIGAGSGRIMARKENGEVWGWGGQWYGGPLGDDTIEYRSSPVLVVGNHSFVKMSAGWCNTEGLKENGELWSWGNNYDGQLGYTPGFQKIPIPINGSHSFVQVSVGESHALALKANGECWGWGSNDTGQLGYTGLEYGWSGFILVHKTYPVLLAPGGHSFIQVLVNGEYNSHGLKANGELWSWGYNNQGAFADGTRVSSTSPVLAVGNHSFVFISPYAGLKANGECWTWGPNDVGQLGTQEWSYVSRSSPVLVVGNHSFIEIYTMTNSHRGLKANGEAWAWGENRSGQLGDGTMTNRSSPVLVIGC